MEITIKEAHENLETWHKQGGVGCIRYVHGPHGGLTGGKERVYKVWDLPKEIQEALLLVCAFCEAPRIEVISVDHELDRIVVYKAL